MNTRRTFLFALVGTALCFGLAATTASAKLSDEVKGKVKSVDADAKKVVVTCADDKEVNVTTNEQTAIEDQDGKKVELKDLKADCEVTVTHDAGTASKIVVTKKAE